MPHHRRPAPPALGRKYSINSENALSDLQRCEVKLEAFEAEVARIEAALLGLSASSAEDALACKNRLAVLSGEVEKLQFGKIDSIMTGGLRTGKAVAKDSRKGLNVRADSLGARVRELHTLL